jgi:hypothetical protein
LELKRKIGARRGEALGHVPAGNKNSKNEIKVDDGKT